MAQKRYVRLIFDNRTYTRYNCKWSGYSDPYLGRLRKRYKLERLVPTDRDQYQTLKNCARWVHNRWKHSGLKVANKSDAISILDEAGKGGRFRCVEYSIVLRACLAALGIKARTLNIMKKSIETKKPGGGHVVVEAYLEKYNKWVLADAQYGTIPILNDMPLNAIELQSAIADKKPLKILGTTGKNEKAYIKWIFPYLFYFRTRLDYREPWRVDPKAKVLTLIPLGSKAPRKFQGELYPLRKVALYTSSARTFYAKP